LFREGLTRLIGRESNLAVCGEADDTRRAFAALERWKPDLVLVDLSLPGKSGLDFIKDVHASHPASVVLVVSMHDEAIYAERVLRAGGRGYIMKQEGPEEMLRAIRQVLEGRIYLSSKMSDRVLDALSGRSARSTSPIAKLTDREFEILRLIGQGQDNRAMARQLNLSSKTVDTHRSNIRRKLELKTATELICYAARWVETQWRPGP
jgi:DNA-binding NarL/FixJ family response regulator